MITGNVGAKIEQLTADLAAVVEKSGIHYRGAILALEHLLERYKGEGESFLNTSNIMDVLSWEDHDVFTGNRANG